MLLALTSCGDKTENPFTQLNRQLDRDSLSLQEIQQRYPEKLWADFYWCDSMLQYLPEENIKDCFDVLNLAQAYLGQFDVMLPIMNRDLSYIRRQLVNLQYDIDHQLVSDSLSAIYLQDETAAADTLHYRVLYFQDRFSQQEKALHSLKKDIRKLTAK